MQNDRDAMRKQQEIDQGLALTIDVSSRWYWGLYSGCIDQGFDKDQAMAIVLATIRKPTYQQPQE